MPTTYESDVVQGEVDVRVSALRFVYPVIFDRDHFDALVRRTESAAWSAPDRKDPTKTNEIVVWKPTSLADDEDLLPHVAEYFNPEDPLTANARVWEMDPKAFDHKAAGLGRKAQWKAVLRGDREIPFELVTITLALFRSGVALVQVRIKPKTNEIAPWIDLLHHFRFSRGGRAPILDAHYDEPVMGEDGRPKKGDDGRPIKVERPFFPAPAGGIPEDEAARAKARKSQHLDRILDAVLVTASGGDQTIWRDVFAAGQLLPFASLFLRDVPDAMRMRLVYRAHRLFHAKLSIHPSRHDLDEQHPSRLQYGENMWFFFSLDGGGFIAFDVPENDFFKNVLPAALDDRYFLIFLVSLHQRFTLMKLASLVVDRWLKEDVTDKAASFELIWRALLDFTARGLFVQVMQRELPHRCYSKWHETFEIGRLFEEVRDEVRQMHEHTLLEHAKKEEAIQRTRNETLERRERRAQERSRRLEERISGLGLIIGLPALLLSFFGVNVKGVTAESEGLSLGGAIALTVLSVLAGVGLMLLMRLEGRRAQAEDDAEDRG